MSTRYPATGIDDNTTLPNPSATNTTNSPGHSSLHTNANDAIKAVETKLGTGATTPASNTLLFGTGAGTSAWQGLTSAQLASVLSDETGTGSVVFANTPTLITPKVDTINEATTGNGVTAGGVNLKSGVLNTNNSVVTNNITDNAVTSSKLATSAITLGYTQTTVDYINNTSTAVQYTGLSVTVTIPSGGRRIEITAFAGNITAGNITTPILTIWDGTVGTGTQLAQARAPSIPSPNYFTGTICVAVVTPAAGTKTYNVGAYNTSPISTTFSSTTAAPSFILVKAI